MWMVVFAVAAVPLQQPASRAAPLPAQDALEAGIERLREDDLEAAIELLGRASGGLPLEDVIRRYENLGVAQAYAGDAAAAERTFARLLAVAPGHVIPYTISPRATFVFEKVRRETAHQPPTVVRLELPESIAYDEAAVASLVCDADAYDLIARWELCQHVKNDAAPYRCQAAPAPPIGQRMRWTLLPVAAAAARTAAGGDQPAALLQLALSGYDVDGNEVFRDPDRGRPREVPLSSAAEAAWYANPLLWSALSVAAVGAALGTVLVAVVWRSGSADVYAEVR